MRAGRLIFAALVVLAAFYWLTFSHQDTETYTQPPLTGVDTKSTTFRGYDCVGDCSGHEAGYNWAESHDIQDAYDCDAAGEHSNSPSFAKGCRAYVDGENTASSDDEDTHNADEADDEDTHDADE